MTQDIRTLLYIHVLPYFRIYRPMSRRREYGGERKVQGKGKIHLYKYLELTATEQPACTHFNTVVYITTPN
jgi:hypothetical protein